EIFAESGFAGARVDEIAKRAGVNKAMIYYRIGDKKALYVEVLHDVFGDTASRISADIRDDHSPEEKLMSYIRILSDTMGLHPHLPNIMMQEIASGGSNFTEVVGLVKVLMILTKILQEGAEKGIFIQTDPLILHMMIAGAIVFHKASLPIREKHFPLAFGKLKDSVRRSTKDAALEVERIVLHAVKV
ncbi:MAG: TetR/AcrR family transcriptional regulator, partial [Deltaproteobacteria bacterium]|nr:TetR/AcrR family transcriptional regulator [Deltaproteobacteria bacterium]